MRDLTAAAGRTDDPDLLARIHSTHAWILSLGTEARPAVATLRSLLAQPGLRPDTVAILHAQLGGVLANLTEGAEALGHLNLAVDGLADDPLRLMAVLFNRAGVLLDRDDFSGAADDYKRAAQIADDSGSPWHAAVARHNWGHTLAAAGDLVGALRLMDAAHPLIAEQSPVSAADADMGRADVLLAAGLPREAAEVFRQCAEVFGAHRMTFYRADAEFYLARTVADSDPREGIAIASRAAGRYRRLGSEQLALRAEALSLTIALGSGRAHAGRVRAARGLVTKLAEPDLASSLDRLQLSLELHHVRAGKPWPRTVDLREDAPIVSRLAEAEVRVEVARLTGSADEALDRARDAIEVLRAWQGTTDSMELRSSMAMHGYRIIEQAAAVAIEGGDPQAIFEWSERSRGFVAGNATVGPKEPDGAEIAELEALRGMLAGTEHHDSPEVNHLRDRVRRRQWARERVSRGGIDIVDLDSAQQKLADQDATLVAYLSSPTDVCAVVVNDRECHVAPIGSRAAIRAALAGLQADLDMAAADLRPALHDAVSQSLRSRLEAISDRVWAPLEKYVDTRRVVVSAPAALAAVPWSLMPPLRDRSISVASSATHWVHHAGARDAFRKVGFIAGPHVPRADVEISHSAKQWAGATVIGGSDATTASVRALAKETDLLHVSAHGRHSPGNPMFSGLELLDGLWLGHDVAELTTVPSVVVLSACELGRSTARWGEETVGMARVWLHSGVRCVIAAPCTVNDTATSDYLAAVHSALASGLSPSDALLAAGPDERAPFLAFGAGF